MASVGARASQSFTVQVAEMAARLRRDGVPLADMRSSESLELTFAGAVEVRMPSADADQDAIERIETDPIIARVVPGAGRGSRLTHFLDGSQRTLQVWRIGLVPVATTIAAAALLCRNAAGEVEIAPGTLRFQHVWLIPRRSGQTGLGDLIELIEGSGGVVVDPLDQVDDDDVYAALAGDYGKLQQAAYVKAREVREQLELKLLDDWENGLPERRDDEWLVVDGRLRSDVRNAVGLVKSMSRQQLTGHEAATVFDLAPGERTTAFRFPLSNWRDLGTRFDVEAVGATGKVDAPTMWYLRLHNSLGQDARHALVRVEAGKHVRDTGQIDELSAWLLAERAPRATSDARWATLLYPIHLLEEILKRRVDAHTRGWPAAR